tara:strand:- start:2162 stop:2788 length:627 start_codon:yes stop_codon:yes gene_type:complete
MTQTSSSSISNTESIVSTCGVEGPCIIPDGCNIPESGATIVVPRDKTICVDLNKNSMYCYTNWRHHLPSKWEIKGDHSQTNKWQLYPTKLMKTVDGNSGKIVLEYHGELMFFIARQQTIIQNNALNKQTIIETDPVRGCEGRLRVYIQPHGSWKISNHAYNIFELLSVCLVFTTLIIACCMGCPSGGNFTDWIFIGYMLSSNTTYYED